MFNKVMVGVDEQSGSRDAITLAQGLVAEGGELTLAHVDLGDPTPERDSGGELPPAERERSLALLGRVRTAAEVEARRICTRSRSVGRGLHELAERERSDLLVLGSCRRGLMGRVFVNDDTRDALNGAPCAIAIAPGGYSARAPMMREVGVGYDGSPESRAALVLARELAVKRGAKLSVFQAIALPASFFNAGVAIGETIDAWVDEARERLGDLGDAEPHVAYGAVAEELTVYSASLDMLFLGSRGYGPVGRLVLGSATLQLAQSARCPLIVLTRAMTAARDADHAETALAVSA